jgi:uncharacterized surface protein with fasciclin (FAS1) repeats
MIFCTLAILLFATACRKEEFKQLPHGEPVPYTDTARHELGSLLGVTPHTLFYSAWQKSHVADILMSQGSGVRFTLLAPDDAAMTAAGFDAAGIAASSAEQMDSLVRYHLIPQQLDTLAVRQQRGSVRHKSMLTDPVMMENLNSLGSNVTYPVPYTYRQYIAMKANGHLIVNGKDAGKATPYYATNGMIWPVNRVLERPRESILDLLQRDPRFSIFAQLYQQTDNIWAEASMGFYERYTYRRLTPEYGVTILSDAFFAPTDEAFRKAGFESVDDLMALNGRSMPYFDWDVFEMRNGFVTDSLLAYHSWGRFYAPAGPFGIGYLSAAIFYSNDLTNENLADFDLNSSSSGAAPIYTMPLEFGSDNAGRVTVKVKGTSHAPATIIEADVNTFQGPIHIVDELILSNKVQY